MALFDLFKKYYTVPCRCFNCGFSQDLRIPKGNTIDSWLSTSGALCSNCGNPTLRRIERVAAPPEVQRPVKEYKPRTMLTREELQVKQQVKYPVKEPVQPQTKEEDKQDDFNFNPKPKKVSFWTGDKID